MGRFRDASRHPRVPHDLHGRASGRREPLAARRAGAKTGMSSWCAWHKAVDLDSHSVVALRQVSRSRLSATPTSARRVDRSRPADTRSSVSMLDRRKGRRHSYVPSAFTELHYQLAELPAPQIGRLQPGQLPPERRLYGMANVRRVAPKVTCPRASAQ